MQKIGEFVKQKRKLHSLTQAELALYAGVSTKFIIELESGKDSLYLNKIMDVLNVFNVELIPVKKER